MCCLCEVVWCDDVGGRGAERLDGGVWAVEGMHFLQSKNACLLNLKNELAEFELPNADL